MSGYGAEVVRRRKRRDCAAPFFEDADVLREFWAPGHGLLEFRRDFARSLDRALQYEEANG